MKQMKTALKSVFSFIIIFTMIFSMQGFTFASDELVLDTANEVVVAEKNRRKRML